MGLVKPIVAVPVPLSLFSSLSLFQSTPSSLSAFPSLPVFPLLSFSVCPPPPPHPHASVPGCHHILSKPPPRPPPLLPQALGAAARFLRLAPGVERGETEGNLPARLPK